MRERLGRWLEIEERLSASGKTKLFALFPIRGSKPVAFVGWYGPWRRYALQPEPNTVFEADCLEAILGLLRRETSDHRTAQRARSVLGRASGRERG